MFIASYLKSIGADATRCSTNSLIIPQHSGLIIVTLAVDNNCPATHPLCHFHFLSDQQICPPLCLLFICLSSGKSELFDSSYRGLGAISCLWLSMASLLSTEAKSRLKIIFPSLFSYFSLLIFPHILIFFFFLVTLDPKNVEVMLVKLEAEILLSLCFARTSQFHPFFVFLISSPLCFTLLVYLLVHILPSRIQFTVSTVTVFK